jgi:hypothetical protein
VQYSRSSFPVRKSGSATSLPSRLRIAYMVILPFCLSAYISKRHAANGSKPAPVLPGDKNGQTWARESDTAHLPIPRVVFASSHTRKLRTEKKPIRTEPFYPVFSELSIIPESYFGPDESVCGECPQIIALQGFPRIREEPGLVSEAQI